MLTLAQLFRGREAPSDLEAFHEVLGPFLSQGDLLQEGEGIRLSLKDGRPYPYELSFSPAGDLLSLRVQVGEKPIAFRRWGPSRSFARLFPIRALQVLFAYAPALEALGLGEDWRRKTLESILLRFGEKRPLLFRLGRRYHALKPRWGVVLHLQADPYGGKAFWQEASLEALFFLLEEESARGRYPLPAPPIPLSHLLSLALEESLRPSEVEGAMDAIQNYGNLLLRAWQSLPPLPREAFPPFLPDGRKTPPLHPSETAPPGEEPLLVHASYWDMLLLNLSLDLPLDLLPYAPSPIRHGTKRYYYAPGWWGFEEVEEGG